MAQQITQERPKNYIDLNRPAAGQYIFIDNPADAAVRINFGPADAVMTVYDLNLVIRFPDGGEIIVHGFFAEGLEGLPDFVLEDGTEYSGLEFLEKLESELLRTYVRQHESGSGEYQDDPGRLIGGLPLSGDLDPFFWGFSQHREQLYEGIDVHPDVIEEVFIVSGELVVSFQMHEDGRPNQYRNARPTYLLEGLRHRAKFIQ